MAKRKRSSSNNQPDTQAAEGKQLSRKAQAQAAAARKRRNQNIMIYGAGAVIVVLIVLVVGLSMRRQQPVAGEKSFASQGNIHIDFGSASPIAYNSVPPTSGPHYENLVAWGIYDEPQRYEHLLHNLEDGGVVIYYQCPEGCAETVAQLEELVASYRRTGGHLVLVPNDPTWTIGSSQPLHQDIDATIALTAWQKLLTLDEFDEDRIRTFVERYEGIDHHRPGVG